MRVSENMPARAAKRPRVLLADDHTLFTEACRKLLEPHCEIVGTAAEGHALLEAAERLKPELVIADISMPRLNGLDAGARLKELHPEVQLIFVTMNEDKDLAAEALRIGAAGYVLKNAAASELFAAIRAARAGRTYVSRQIQSASETPAGRKARLAAGGDKLTPRQKEVLQLLAEGYSMKEIAAMLRVAQRTVAFHKYAMMDRLGLRSNAALVQYALRRHMLA
jgi:DNA-binding NarL/FixJ family response regulator